MKIQQVQIRSIENQRLLAQATWIERAAVDWARLILRDDQPAPRPPDSAQSLPAIPGYTPAMVAALEPFITVLPERTLVNANTADPEVLSAVINNLALDRARELVRQRDRAYFNNVGDLQTKLVSVAPQADTGNLPAMLDVRTHYFLIHGLAGC